MPKSKPRKRNGRPVTHRPRRVTPPAADPFRQIGTIGQGDVARVIDGLEDLLNRPVLITGYNPDVQFEAVEHHHAASTVIDYLITHRVVELLATLAGGEMLVMADEPADPPVPPLHREGVTTVWAATHRTGIDYHEPDPATMDNHQWPPRATMCGRSTLSATSWWGPRDQADGIMKPCPRCYPLVDQSLPLDIPTLERVRDGLAGLPETGERGGPVMAGTYMERVTAFAHLGEDHCPVCGRIIQRDARNRYRRHGKRHEPCYGSGLSRNGMAFHDATEPASAGVQLPRREVLR